MSTPGYYPDLSTFPLAQLKAKLQTIKLLPSQQILQENLDEHFARLEQNGIKNLAQLQKALKTKAAVQSFSQTTGLSVDYLTILRREVNGYLPKPINLKDFPGINSDVVRKLQQAGIRNTEQLFPNVLTHQDRTAFAEQHQIEPEDLLKLTKLTDIARTRWVGPKFAKLLSETEYDTVEKIVNADHQKLYRALVRANAKSGIYKGKFGAEDMRLWIETVAEETPQSIQY